MTEPGVHGVWRTVKHAQPAVRVSPELAFMHHYRNCESPNSTACFTKPVIVDESIADYLESLRVALEHTKMRVKRHCDIAL